jgi:hypothetical protein
VAFDAVDSELVPSDTNSLNDVFIHDRRTHVTKLVSVGRRGAPANGFSLFAAISAEGRYVAFYSEASNLVRRDTNTLGDVFVRDREANRTTRVNVGPGEAQANGSSFDFLAISANGRVIAFSSEARAFSSLTRLSF